jgi:hypothetical protein
MKAANVPALIAVGGLLLLSAPALESQERTPTRLSQSTPPPTQPPIPTPAPANPPVVSAPVYKPPLRGAPGGRVGGGTRGTGREVFVLSVLAPDHTGLTSQEQPVLYWFISGQSTYPVEIVVTDPNATQPLLETRLAPPVPAGVHSIRLADHGIKLAPGIPYRWYVAVVPDTNRRSKDILAGGVIERAELPDALKANVATADKQRAASLYAETGYWYDAMRNLSELIEASPQNAELRRVRAAMLAQVGLPKIGEE